MTDTPDDSEGTVARLKASGNWNPLWDGMDELDPKWADQYLAATIEPYESEVLSPQTVQLLCIAVDAACTHLFAPGIRRHIRAALDVGVTKQEIFEVLKLTTTLGIHSMNVGLPILREEAEETAPD